MHSSEIKIFHLLIILQRLFFLLLAVSIVIRFVLAAEVVHRMGKNFTSSKASVSFRSFPWIVVSCPVNSPVVNRLPYHMVSK